MLAMCLVWTCTARLAWGADEGQILLYLSPTTERYFAGAGRSYEQIIKRWPAYLRKYGEHARTLGREELLADPPTGVLILPTTVALDPQERAAIERFALRGGSLLGTGLVGSRDAQGQPAGLDFLHTSFQVRSHGFFPVNDNTFFVPFGDGPLTWPIPAARRMGLSNTSGSLLRISASHTSAVALDWSRNVPAEPHAVMAFEETPRGRVAYFGVSDDAWPAQRDNLLLLDATLAWLRREPHAYKAAWPHGHQAAHLIEMDTEDQFESAPNLARDLENAGYKGTFYCLTTEAVRHPDIVRDLLRRGHEIAYHADVHFGFKGDAVREQELRIRFMKQQMAGILGERAPEATGFRAPTESYDRNTEMLLRRHGLLHHAADESSHEDRLPFFSVSEPGVPPERALVVLPRTQMDDVSFRLKKLTPEQVGLTLANDLDLAVRSGAFSLLSVHSQNYVEGGLMRRTMPDYLRKVTSYGNRLWVTRGDEITRWWRQREAVSVDSQWRSGGLRLILRNANPEAVAGFTVFVTLPARQASLKVTAASASKVAARTQSIDPFRAAIVIDSLPPGQTELRLNF